MNVRDLSVDIVMGAQWGSESKGLFAVYLGANISYDWLASCATRNAGHTAFTPGGVKLVARYLPASCITSDAPIFISAGTCLHRETLEDEIDRFEAAGINVRNRLFISKCAGLLTHHHEELERHNKMDVSIGSTCEGVGEALCDRILRRGELFIDRNSHSYAFKDDLDLKGHILLECSQGYLLSNLSRMYPYTTSRICSASAYLSYAKLPPQAVRDVYGVFRTWPIRVANRTPKPLDNTDNWDPTNSSGPMNGLEASWQEVRDYCGATEEQLPTEITTVTKLPRRIARWNTRDVKDAIRENGITRICVSFLNYIDWSCYGARRHADLPRSVKTWLLDRENELSMPFALISTSPRDVFPRWR
jgi:adenylosuccinate synthase